MSEGEADGRFRLNRLREWVSGGPPIRHLLSDPLQDLEESDSGLGLRTPLRDLVTGKGICMLIPSLWFSPEALLVERSELRTRRMEAGIASVLIHFMAAGIAVWFAVSRPAALPGAGNPVILVRTPLELPYEGDGLEGGGGGGGGKQEELPASAGTLPETGPVQYMPPDPGQPKPLVPAEDPLEMRASLQMPIQLPYDAMQPVGDITPPSQSPASSGPGKGGGIGDGDGTSIGPGRGPGAGPGANGGMGGGPDGGIGPGTGSHTGGPGFTLPVLLEDPKPPYSEEARKARAEGILILSVVIRTDGRVGGIRIVKGLGYGLDESAIRTVAERWRFRPAMSGGRAVEFPATIEVTFRLY
jgi:TonB family protein